MTQAPAKNPVAKHARKFNKASVQLDRKKRSRRGYRKHRAKTQEVA